MTSALIAALLSTLTAAPPLAPPPPDPACALAPPVRAAAEPGRLRRLDQLPPALHQLAVLKTIGGCSVLSVKVGDAVVYVPEPRRGPPFKPLDGRARTQR